MPILGKLIALLLAALGSSMALYAAGPPLGAAAVVPLDLTTRPLELDADDAAVDRVGQLRFAGGLVLASRDPAFGGLSGLAWAPGCHALLAVSDTGNWVALRPRLAGERLIGIDAGWMTAIRDMDARPTPSKEAGDAEGLAFDPAGGEALVSYEQDHRVRRFAGIDPCRPATLATAARGEARPPAWAGWQANGGAEALARSPGGWTLAIGERSATGDDRHQALLARDPLGPTLRFPLLAPRGFAPTDALFLDDRRVLVLFRQFSPWGGAAAVVARYDLGPVLARAAAVRTDLVDDPRPIAGVELGRLAPPRVVDNMEGMAIERRDGRAWLWLVSDDNFNPLQRTLLLRFELMPDASSSRNAARRARPVRR